MAASISFGATYHSAQSGRPHPKWNPQWRFSLSPKMKMQTSPHPASNFLHLSLLAARGGCTMAATPEETTRTTSKDATPSVKIDPTALAGSRNSLGAESVRDGRPTTDDDIVEAMDEATPVTPDPPSK
jgi:hypothetical protein